MVKCELTNYSVTAMLRQFKKVRVILNKVNQYIVTKVYPDWQKNKTKITTWYNSICLKIPTTWG